MIGLGSCALSDSEIASSFIIADALEWEVEGLFLAEGALEQRLKGLDLADLLDLAEN